MIRRLAALVALTGLLLALAVPVTALAAGAGDDQYTDPLAPPPSQSGGGNGSGQASGQQGGESATPAQTASSTLPRTGLSVAVIGATGTLFLAAGIALRRRTGASADS